MFIPADFKIPEHLVTDQFRFVVLEPSLTVIDYAAVMSSQQRLTRVFAEHDDWPAEDMTLEENTADLARHEKEFHAREAFAYAVFNPTQDRYLGCVYLKPTEAKGYDCAVYLWVRDSELQLDEALFNSVETWLQQKWPFKKRAYPGRTIAWAGSVHNSVSFL